jgi:uncharacterized CHY-type Zn-finger protein
MKFKRKSETMKEGEMSHPSIKVNIVLVDVSSSVCGFCKGENWIDEGISTKPCPSCGGKQTNPIF